MKKARRASAATELNITSMMDMMTIILVFLLKSFASTEVNVTPSDELVLPFSTATKNPELAVQLTVERDKIIVDGVEVMQLIEVDDPNNPGQKVPAVAETDLKGQLIGPLSDRLTEKAETAKAIGEKTGNEKMAFKGQILLMVDSKMPFNVLRSVMYTAGQAQFGEFRFVVYKLRE